VFAPQQNLPADQRRLLKLYKGLSRQDQESLVAFAEFLFERGGGAAPDEVVVAEPRPIPRPEQESVVAAIKRLSQTYFMIDKSKLFTETSSLMTAHIMQGRTASEVIDDLEVLFETHYQENYLNNK